MQTVSGNYKNWIRHLILGIPQLVFTEVVLCFYFHQVNVQELSPTAGYPSPEMVECLRQIGELSEKHNEVEKHVASVVESQQVMAGDLAKVEETLPRKVSKEDLNIPDDLQDQLAMLKQGVSPFWMPALV